ncbi:MAG: hypothetical protein IJ719_08180 [Clostridia bacterium]|nr:hypothetical protein [Clostridia bacterium]
MLAVIAQLNDYERHIPYDYRDGIHPEWDEKIEISKGNEEWVKNWPIYNNEELQHLKNRLEMVCTDALAEGIHAVFTIVKIAGTPSKLTYGFPYQPMMSDLFEDDAEVFAGNEKIIPFSPIQLLSFRPSIYVAEEDEVGVTMEEFKTSQLVDEMDVVENTKEPIALTRYNAEILFITSDYVIYRDGGFKYHKTVIEDDGFKVGDLWFGFDECFTMN